MKYVYATWLADVLRDAGLEVVEHEGWKTRGLPGGVFVARSVVWHHDASPAGDSPGVPAYMLRRFATAAAQLWVDRRGVWHVLAAGRAPHAGVVIPGKPTNYTSLGVETDHTTGEAWPAAQLDSLRRGTAAILARAHRRAGKGLHFHKSICLPPGRKSDPAGLDLAAERARVAALQDPAAVRIHVSAADLRAAAVCDPRMKVRLTAPAATLIVQRALKAEGLLARYLPGRFGLATRRAYGQWQRSLGYRGKAANGYPGEDSLRALGARHDFGVTP